MIIPVQRIPTIDLAGTGLVLRSVTVPGRGNTSAPYLLEIEPAPDAKCPACHKALTLKWSAPRVYADLPWGLNPVKWQVTSGRGYCRTCKQIVVAELPAQQFIHKCATRELGQYLVDLMGTAPVRSLGERVGLSYSQVQKIQKALLLSSKAATDRISHLGLDELYMLKAKHLVALDMQVGKILKLASVGSSQEGRADLVDLNGFLSDLPEADVITVDMHQDQLRAVRRRWPAATVVIDQRHLLQVIDRDLITLAGRVIRGRWEDTATADELLPEKATRVFGRLSYPFLYLRALILRRQRNLTPADHAAWLLLRAEGGEAQVLYEAYLWREALYDLYDQQFSEEAMKLGLERWITGVQEWQKPYRTQKTYRDHRGRRLTLPLGNSACLVWLHRQEILNYAQYRVTNALTERTNARIRKLIRAGHRYSPETLVTLVNRELESQPSTGRVVTPTVWLPEKKGRAAETTSPVVELALPPKQPEPLLPLPIPADFDYQNLPIPEPSPAPPSPPTPPPVLRVRKPRSLPRCSPELGLPEPIWVWLHTKQSRQLGSPAWVKRLMEHAPPADIIAWHLLCAGRVSGVGMPVIEARQLELWRATALWMYVQHHPGDLNARERERQPFLAGLDLRTLAHLQPEVISPLCAAWLTLVERFASLPLELEGLMLTVINWQRLSEPEGQREIAAFRTGSHKDCSIWDSWCSAAAGQVELMPMVVRWHRHLGAPGLPLVTVLVADPELRWLTALEWAAAQAVEMETLGPLQKLHAFKKTVKLLDEHSMKLGVKGES